MGWIIYNSRGEPLVTQEVTEHEHTAGTGEGGALTDDEHIGFSKYEKIAIPSAPDADEGKLFSPLLTGNDSLVTGDVGIDETGLYHRRPDGLMIKLSEGFPYSVKMHHAQSASYPHGGVDEAVLTNSWINYGDTWEAAKFVKDFLGCVWIQGFIKSGGIGGVVMTLPEDCWTDSLKEIWGTITSDVFGRMDAVVDGTVLFPIGTNTWATFVRMAYPAADRMTWHNVLGGVGFENNWVNFAAGTHGVARYAKDAIGRVWIQGLVKDGVDGTTVFTLPAGYRPAAGVHVESMANNVVAKIQVNADGTVVANVLAGSTAYITINCIFTADGEESAPWREVGAVGEPAFANSWVNFAGGWDTAGFYKDACGVVHIKGLIRDGTSGLPAFTLPVGYRPKRPLHIGALSFSDKLAKLQVFDTGLVVPTVFPGAANNWFTIHVSFVAEQ